MTDKSEYNFVVEAGLLVRGAIKRSILVGCWANNIPVTVEESRGLLRSTYRFTVTATPFQARAVETALGDLLEEFAK